MASHPQKPTQANYCQGCTVCCRVLAVPDTPGQPKKAYSPCPWLHTKYSGCSIHEHKPDTCRAFECHYVKLARRTDLTTSCNLRPDNCGVMLVHLPQRLYFMAHITGSNRAAWKSPEPWAIIEGLLNQGFRVIISWGPEPRKLLLQKVGEEITETMQTFELEEEIPDVDEAE